MFFGKKIEILKFVDHWVGGPVCLLLAGFHRITHPFYRTLLGVGLDKPLKSILVIKFFGLGSILLASPMIRALKARHPNTSVTFLTFEANADLVRRMDICDAVRTVDPRNPVALIFSIASNLGHFMFHRPDVSIDLEYYSKFSTIMSYCSGARWRVGFYIARLWRNSLVNVPIYFNYARHILDIYGMVGSVVGADVKDPVPARIPVSTDEEGYVNWLLSDRRLSQADLLVGVNVNASDLAHCRKWPHSNFAQVITALLKESKELKIILTGSESERKYTSSVLELVESGVKDRVFDLSGAFSFGQYIALLGRLRLLLTNDSGPFHLAKAQGVPTVSIWGPGSPDLYGPYKDERTKHKVIYKRWSCSPCLYIYRTDAGHFCGKTTPCLSEVSSQEVILLVQKALREVSGVGGS